MGLKMKSALLLLLSISHTALSQEAHGAEASSAASSGSKSGPGGAGAYSYPPPPVDGRPGIPGGFGGFPGFGFNKNLDFSAGFGPYGGLGGGFPGGFGGGLPGGLGALLGGGGLPPPGEFEDIGAEAGLGGPFGGGGFGGFGPSYIPSTWVGSALGAKGDLLFPIVIFVFFIVGIWTAIQLLLGFIVPLIAAKLALKGPLKAAGLGGIGGLFRRDTAEITGAPVSPDLDFITTSVLDAINEPKCLKYVACHSGKFLNSMAGGGDQKNSTYEGILKTLSSMARSDALKVFEEAFVNGSCDCSKFTCDKTVDPHTHHQQGQDQGQMQNATDPETNEVH